MEASRPLVAALRDGRPVERGGGAGVPPPDVGDGRVRGHGTGIERARARRTGPERAASLSGSDPGGVTPEEADELFDLQIGILTAGIARIHAGDTHAGDMAGDTSGD